jgi:hypothetical protein
MQYTLKITEGTKITPYKHGGNSSPPLLFFFLHTRMNAVMSNTIENGRTEFIVDGTKPGDGISHFTIFDEYRQPVCERLYFKRPARTLQITAAADQPLYDLRKKINIDISSATEEGKVIPANMSMAVYRLDSLSVIDEQDINNFLLLSSDLTERSNRGNIILNNDNCEATDNPGHTRMEEV